ncbi:MAG: hypothetical protein RR382_13750, partial [Tannerellaceae bacterium]
MEKALAYLTGTDVKSKKELEELGWKHKEFSKDISPEFQKAVENSTKKVQDFHVFLKELGFDNIITQEESAEFTNQVNTMCDEAIRTIQSKKEESQKSLKELFVADDGVVDAGEQKVLEILSRSSDAQVAEVSQLKADILAINQRAVDEKRTSNEQEIADVNAKVARIRQIELESVGGTQEEIMYAKNEFLARVQTMNASEASKLLQEKAKNRDEEIVQVKASYDTEIEMLKAQAQTKSGEERKALEDQAANLEVDKQKKIQSQKDLYDKYLGIIKESNPKLLDAINQYNGDVLTRADIKGREHLARMQGEYDGLNTITESGCYQIYNKNKGMYENMAVTVDEKTKDITGMYNSTTSECAGYSEKMANSAQKMANSQDASFQRIMTAEGMYVDYTSGAVCLANGQAVGSLNDLTAATDGTRSGIIDINGTPYEITVHKDGTIGALNEISAAADD